MIRSKCDSFVIWLAVMQMKVIITVFLPGYSVSFSPFTADVTPNLALDIFVHCANRNITICDKLVPTRKHIYLQLLVSD